MFTATQKSTIPTLSSFFLMLLTLLITSVLEVPAQSILPPRLALKDAIEKALENNPQTKVSDSRLKIAELKIQEARTGRKPFVQFSQSAIRSNNPVFVFGSLLEQGRFGPSNFAIDSLNNPSGLTNLRSLVSGSMPLFDQHQTKARVDQAMTAKSQVELRAEGTRQQLRFDVLRNFYGVVLGKEMLKVSNEAVRSAEANRKKTRNMVDVGMTTDADFLAAEVEVANAGQQKLEAESALIVSSSALNLLLGDKPEVEREFVGDLQEKYFPADEQNELILLAFANRPDYVSSELAIKNSQKQTKAVKDLKLPRVDAFGNFGYSSPYITNGSTDYTVGVSLSYTLFDAGRKARNEQAVEAETLAESEKNLLANQISLEVVRAFQSHKTAKAKIQVSIKSIAQAEEARRIVQDRYRFGLTTFNEVIRAESALVRAKHNLLTARYDYFVSYASLLLATGRLTDVRLFD